MSMSAIAAPEPGAISHVSIATVHLRNQDEARRFYQDVLGFDGQFGPDFRWLTVVPPGADTAIVLVRGFMENAAAPAGGATGLCLETPNLESLHARLVERGIAFTRAPNDQRWGKHQFIDQDGNEFVLIELPRASHG